MKISLAIMDNCNFLSNIKNLSPAYKDWLVLTLSTPLTPGKLIQYPTLKDNVFCEFRENSLSVER